MKLGVRTKVAVLMFLSQKFGAEEKMLNEDESEEKVDVLMDVSFPLRSWG